jgi:hypothetical protein
LGIDEKTAQPSSSVHDYQYTKGDDGIPKWNSEYEYYGYNKNNINTVMPEFTYADFMRYDTGLIGSTERAIKADKVKDANGKTAWDRYQAFNDRLMKEAGNADNMYLGWGALPIRYYKGSYNIVFNDKQFKEIYNSLQNQQTIGRASIRKQSVFLQDTWQVNANTILSPIIRLDHSSLFGSTITANMGMTHNLSGNSHRRLKANFGTGYTEPGMGELYYNWEMYSGSVAGMGTGRLGWYWIGNPELKPEKSVNIDLSVEGENAHTYARAGVFYNRIRDYMTTYFTGNLIDFHPEANEKNQAGAWKFMNPPDMIYSFKNIGKAEITGFQASVEQKFGSHWKGKLGYAWLHAVNKSDPDMPRQLLDKPQHKVDIGISYDNVQSGWSGSLWGDYYINMLDSNSVAGNGNYMSSWGVDTNNDGKNDSSKIEYNFAEGGKQHYQKKTFGIWNVIVQKKLDKDSLVYFGVDNIFNHRDYDRALQERVYKMGFNMKFGYDGHKKEESKKAVVTNVVAGGQGTGVAGKDENAVVSEHGNAFAESAAAEQSVQRDAFITVPFDVDKKPGVELIVDYQARWNVHGGSDKSVATVTATTHVGDAAKNMLDQKSHGFEQRLRLGFDARIGDNTNVTVLGSASGMSGVDTKHDVSGSKGLNHQRLDTVDVTQHANKWDFSIGRLTESMGVTGYWFGKEYDGGRAVWTSGKNQVRLGYGDFSSSTGVNDSAYTHATRQTFYRAPTAGEFLGTNHGMYMLPDDLRVLAPIEGAGDTINFYQQLKAAKTEDEQAKILKHMFDLVKQAYGDVFTNDKGLNDGSLPSSTYAGQGPIIRYTYTDKSGQQKQAETYVGIGKISVLDPSALEAPSEKAYMEQWLNTGDNLEQTAKQYNEKWESVQASLVQQGAQDIQIQGGAVTNWQDFVSQGIAAMPDVPSSSSIWGETKQDEHGNYVSDYISTSARVQSYWSALENFLYHSDQYSALPREKLGNTVGLVVKVTGTVLQKDTIPAIERAAYIQARHSFSPDFGVMAWYLRSTGDDNHSFAAAHGDTNDIASFDQLANVFGIGAQWHVGDRATVSLDYGQNRTDFGRYMNGGTIYENHEAGNSTFDFGGRASGGTPHFWVARVDIGKSDTDRPGSWNAFADYKYFQYGSFFGGNGTEGVPDRYLDGIKSFTVGGGYVPAKDILLEAFYTFDAKGIGKRDTLYGSENFSLGDYTRIQATFRF